MKKAKIIYWASTGILSFMMLFSAYAYLTNPKIAEGFHYLGFPDYFRVELAIAKMAGVLVLLLPFTASRIKEWAYAGFGITFLSASIAHSAVGDPAGKMIMPLIMLGILSLSYIYKDKIARLSAA